MSPSHAIFLHGLVQSVPRPWTGAERPWPSHVFFFFGGGGQKNAISPLLSQRKQKYWCYYPHRLRDLVSPVGEMYIISNRFDLISQPQG